MASLSEKEKRDIKQLMHNTDAYASINRDVFIQLTQAFLWAILIQIIIPLIVILVISFNGTPFIIREYVPVFHQNVVLAWKLSAILGLLSMIITLAFAWGKEEGIAAKIIFNAGIACMQPVILHQQGKIKELEKEVHNLKVSNRQRKGKKRSPSTQKNGKRVHTNPEKRASSAPTVKVGKKKSILDVTHQDIVKEAINKREATEEEEFNLQLIKSIIVNWVMKPTKPITYRTLNAELDITQTQASKLYPIMREAGVTIAGKNKSVLIRPNQTATELEEMAREYLSL